MDVWASVYGNKVGFLCASCAGPELARSFGERLKLKHCKNVWLDENNMPTWGQLGCNGFIILDETHSVKCKATAAFLQVKQEAFRFVEKMLSAWITVENTPRVTTACSEAPASTCANIRLGQDLTDPIPSVKVDILDEEHHECEEALRILRDRRDAASLSQFLTVLQDHFRHEERLLDEYVYTEQTFGFSADTNARKSHFADHARILEEIEAYLGYAVIPTSAVNDFNNRFYTHTTRYDVDYADRLSEAMKK